MAKLAMTVQEARDHILKRMDAEDSADYQALVLEILNQSAVFISGTYDWEYLRKKGTLTFADGTGVVSLPTDLDRVLAIHKSGSDYNLTKLQPSDFESVREDENVDVPQYYCVTGYAQDTTTSAPSMEIEVLSAPGAGDAYTIWYIKHIDEFTTDDLATVPNLPPHIWDIIVRKSILEGLKMQGTPVRTVQQEEQHFLAMLMQYRRREDFGSTQYRSIKQDPYVSAHYATRGRR